MRWANRALGVAAAVVILVLFGARLGIRGRPDVVRIDRVWFAPALAEAPPAAGSSEWRAAVLPWDWRPRGDGRAVWCRAEFALAEKPARPLQLLIAQVAYGADVFINGKQIAAVGRGPSGWWGRREIVWLPIDAGFFRAGANALTLRLEVRSDFAGYLTPVFVGPASSLQGHFRARNGLLGLPDILALISGALTLLFLSVFRSDRRPQWAWVTGALAALTLAGLPWRTVDFWLWPLGLAAATACVACALHSASQITRPRIERAAFALVAAIALGQLLGPARLHHALGLLATALAAANTFYLLILYSDARTQRWLERRGAMPAAVLLGLLFFLNDLPLFWNRAPWLGIPLLPIAHGPILIAGAAHLVRFLTTRLARARELNRSLQESQARLLELERERATRAERERVQRDLHDGLGAQLVAALAVAEREPQDSAAVRRVVRIALGELRGAVDSLDGGESELNEVLGAARARLEPLVQDSGARFAWRVGEFPVQPRLTPQQALHLLRILQEAIANAVKHSGARSIEVASGAAERAGQSAAFVEVSDDGSGVRDTQPGRGFANMRQRAAFIGCEITFDSSAAGTRVRLWIPVAPPTLSA